MYISVDSSSNVGEVVVSSGRKSRRTSGKHTEASVGEETYVTNANFIDAFDPPVRAGKIIPGDTLRVVKYVPASVEKRKNVKAGYIVFECSGSTIAEPLTAKYFPELVHVVLKHEDILDLYKETTYHSVTNKQTKRDRLNALMEVAVGDKLHEESVVLSASEDAPLQIPFDDPDYNMDNVIPIMITIKPKFIDAARPLAMNGSMGNPNESRLLLSFITPVPNKQYVCIVGDKNPCGILAHSADNLGIFVPMTKGDRPNLWDTIYVSFDGNNPMIDMEALEHQFSDVEGKYLLNGKYHGRNLNETVVDTNDLLEADDNGGGGDAVEFTAEEKILTTERPTYSTYRPTLCH